MTFFGHFFDIEFLMKKNGITHLTGFGKLESESNISVFKEGRQKHISAKNIILATGATKNC